MILVIGTKVRTVDIYIFKIPLRGGGGYILLHLMSLYT